jgi:hypothetical protein
MINATKFPQMFSPDQLNAILKFEHNRINKTLDINDLLPFINFMENTVYNILTPENIEMMKSNIDSENIFFESFYFVHQLNKLSTKIPNHRAKPFDFILAYLHHNELFDHYYIIDTYLELY